jgi:3-hydroxyisobutyrate dehydrogenase-like beta-hydroxyacid dehydrogenase
MNVGIIGLGAMGFPMTEALLAAGHRVVAFDVSETARARAEAAGAEVAASNAEVGAAVSVVLLSLPKPEHVEAVVTGEDGLLTRPAKGLVIADTSTVDPETTRRVASAASERGVAYLDTPILGRPDACGRWTFPVGGDPAALERARPALDALGKSVIHVGPPGAGNAIKLLNNLMFGAINAVTAEAMAACAAVGVSPATFYQTVAGSEAATVSPLFRVVGRKIVEGDFDPIFTVDLMHKDVALAVAMLDAGGIDAIIGNAVLAQIDHARAAGLGSADTSAVSRMYGARRAARDESA